MRRKNGEYTPAKGIRLSLEEAHAVLELVTDETFEWNDLDEVPTRKRTKTTK
jgi:hypothetical protein